MSSRDIHDYELHIDANEKFRVESGYYLNPYFLMHLLYPDIFEMVIKSGISLHNCFEDASKQANSNVNLESSCSYSPNQQKEHQNTQISGVKANGTSATGVPDERVMNDSDLKALWAVVHSFGEGIQ